MWIKTSDQLPPECKYVLGRHNRGTWHDSEDQANVNCVVVKMKRGISVLDREKMERGEIPNPKVGPNWCLSEGYTYSLRSKIYTSDDEWGNNTVPYSFHTFGPDHYFGQTITHWQLIEEAPAESEGNGEHILQHRQPNTKTIGRGVNRFVANKEENKVNRRIKYGSCECVDLKVVK